MDATDQTAPFALDDVSKAGFRSTADADAVSERLRQTLGFGYHNIPARLGIARSLSIPSPPPMATGEQGREMRGLQLFGSGADLATWVSLIIEHAGRAPTDLNEFRSWVRAHWVRGMSALKDLLDQADNDPLKFWQLIAEGLGEGKGATSGEAAGWMADAPAAKAVTVRLGEDARTGEPVEWRVNAKGSAPHSALMGASGTGKTTTAISILKDIREATGVPMVVFDLKADLTQPDKGLDRILDARVVSPRTEPVPLDVLHLTNRSPNEITLAAQKLRDILGALKGSGFGAVQKSLFVEAAERALNAHTPCTLDHVRDALSTLYQEQGRNPDGATNTMDELCRLKLFDPKLSPPEFFRQSWIIQLPDALSQSVRVSVVTLVAEALNRHLSEFGDAPVDADGNRALRVVLVIDEAHHVLETHVTALGNLLRVSRSRGGAVMLISQRPDDFDAADADFLADMGLILSFQTNAEARSVERLFAKGANVAKLGRGEAWVKMGGEARRVVVWR